MKISCQYLGTALALLVASTHAATKYPPEVATLIDESVNPCDDFYQYACGGWLKSFKLPADRGSYSYAFDGISDRNRDVLLDIYKQDKPIIGAFFKSCMNVEQINKLGTKPIEPMRAKIAAVETKKELFVLAGETSLKALSFLSDIGVGTDPRDTTRYVFMAGQSEPTLGDTSYYTDKDTWFQYEEAFRTHINKLFSLVGYNATKAAALTKTVLELEQQVAAIIIPNAQMIDQAKRYSFMNVSEAMTKYPNILGAFIEGTKVLETTSLQKSETMVFINPMKFYDGIEHFIQLTPLDSLKALFEFQFLNAVADYLGEDFLLATFELHSKALRGQQARTPREEKCARAVKNSFPALVGKYYFEARLDEQSQETAQKSIDIIEKVMAKRIEESTWLDDETRKHALKKLGKVTNLIGRAKYVEEFDKTALNAAQYYANMESISMFHSHDQLNNINKRVDHTKWSMSPADVNAYYSSTQNMMGFPAGILQPPFFKGSYLPAQNFGAIGSFMAHELTHGFDNSGRSYDGDGKVYDWWSNTTAAKFEKRAQCLVDQYSKFQLRSYTNSSVIIGNVNGKLTLDENIADNGGFGLAFDAFHEFMKQERGQKQQQQQRQQQQQQQQQQQRRGKPKTKPTPGNSMTLEDMDRLFFLSFAQAWCFTSSEPAARALLNELHTPHSFRVIGTLQNNRQFGKLFNCKVGTYMNPKDKCQVW